MESNKKPKEAARKRTEASRPRLRDLAPSDEHARLIKGGQVQETVVTPPPLRPKK